MTAQPAYPFPVDHPPLLLTHGLPSNGTVTAADLNALPTEEFWSYQVSDGQVLVHSPHAEITWSQMQTFPDQANWRFELLGGVLILTHNAPGLAHQSCVLSLPSCCAKRAGPAW
jgi:hypothetical protein